MPVTQWIQYNSESGIIHINVGGDLLMETKVLLLDASGSLCETFVLAENGTIKINTGLWPSGTWFIRVEKNRKYSSNAYW